jgi:predicted O-methyltransferase YrrM
MSTYHDFYQAALATPSDINEHLAFLMHRVVELDAKKVIELGVRFGTSTVALLYGLERTEGHLWSVDIARSWMGIPDERWTFILGDDLDAQVHAQLPDKVDLIFVDTDHRYELTKREILHYAPLVRPGGAMIFHDTNVERFEHHVPGTEPPYPVRMAVNELLGEKVHGVFLHNHGLTEVWM